MIRYAIGLGSNEGDRLENLRLGIEGLRSIGDVGRVSSLYETEPVGGPDQAPYLNAVAIVVSPLDPGELLEALNEIEGRAGRVRRVKWGPRTLDLDIVASDGDAVDSDRLEIPHPRAGEREFVLRPLVEVWPDADVGGISAKDGLGQIDDQGVELLRRHWVDDTDRRIGLVLVSIQMAWFIGIGLAFAADGSLPGGSVEITHIAGGFFAFVGIILALLASRRLGPALTAVPEPVEGSELVEGGPYALARHPIYGGIILFLTGTALFLDSVLGFVLSIGLAVFFTMKSRYEERRLRAKYATYRAYSRRVRHRLIPFLF